MFCPNCGNQLHNEQFCPNCGFANHDSTTSVDDANSAISNAIPSDLFCPACGSQELQITVETDTTTTGKNFSAGKGCLGYLLMGPLGILCGSCGQHQQTIVKNKQYFVCKRCGKKFRNPKELRESVEKNKKSIKMVGIMTIVCEVFMLALSAFILSEFGFGGIFAIAIAYGIAMGVLFGVLFHEKRKMETELNEIEQAMAKFKNRSL